jgi:hypothetical protein
MHAPVSASSFLVLVAPMALALDLLLVPVLVPSVRFPGPAGSHSADFAY